MLKKYSLRNYNFKLLIFTIALAVIGVLAVGSAEESLQSKQMIGMIAGAFIMIVISLIDYEFLLKLYWFYYAIEFVALVLVLILGSSSNGAQRWIRIGGITFQPSELCKVIIILCIAAFVNRHYEEFNTFKYIFLSILLFGILAALVYTQPDLSTTIVLCIIFATIMFVANISWRFIIGVFAVAVPIFIIVLFLIMQPEQHIVSDYQKSRIMSFFNQEDSSNDEG